MRGENICLVLRRRSDEMMNEANENSSVKYAGQKHIRTFCSKRSIAISRNLFKIKNRMECFCAKVNYVLLGISCTNQSRR